LHGRNERTEHTKYRGKREPKDKGGEKKMSNEEHTQKGVNETRIDELMLI
jgi:hypothetical protein